MLRNNTDNAHKSDKNKKEDQKTSDSKIDF